jgi:xanthosine utilization system XapX-like protein
VGLLGILLGEQIPPLVRHIVADRAALSWLHQIKPHVFGQMPSGRQVERDAP